jgi:hypothetical protein
MAWLRASFQRAVTPPEGLAFGQPDCACYPAGCNSPRHSQFLAGDEYAVADMAPFAVPATSPA